MVQGCRQLIPMDPAAAKDVDKEAARCRHRNDDRFIPMIEWNQDNFDNRAGGGASNLSISAASPSARQRQEHVT